MRRKSLAWFLVIAFAMAWTLFLAPLAFGPVGTPARQFATLIAWAAAMWAPGIGALVVTRFVDRRPLGALNLRRLGEKRSYLWAWLLPPALTLLAGLLTWAFGLGRLDLEFGLIRESMAQIPGGAAIPAGMVVLIQGVLALTLAPLFNTLFSLGEELGWRGYLLPGLLPLGQWRAILFSGLVWGLWHAPAILQGHNYPQHPVLGVFLMIGFCTLMGAVFSWLYLRTRSPWAPALAHGSLNAVAGFPLLALVDVDLAYGGTLTSLVGWIPIALFIGLLVWARQLPFESGDVSRETEPPGAVELPADPTAG